MEHIAHQFVEAIKSIAEKPDNFPVWIEKYANTPEGITCEMREFATVIPCYIEK